VVRRQALGWLGAAVCSVALVIAGGLVLSSFAVHRYLQASHSALQRGESPAAGASPEAAELASLKRTVSGLAGMPGVTSATTTTTTTADYDVAVTMTARATADQCADVVFAMTKDLQNPRIDLELTMPASSGRAASVIDYRNAFDTPVPRSTVDSVSRAVAVAAAVPGVTSVHVTVPYTWNLASGDLDIEMAANAMDQNTAVRNALAHTVLADVAWWGAPAPTPSPSAASSGPPEARHAPTTPQVVPPTQASAPTRTPTPTQPAMPMPSSTPTAVSPTDPAEPSPTH